jgi:hypothetical protein
MTINNVSKNTPVTGCVTFLLEHDGERQFANYYSGDSPLFFLDKDYNTTFATNAHREAFRRNFAKSN